MNKYNVFVPIAGYVQIEVEAENEKDTIDKAFEQGCSAEDISEFDMFEHIAQGNVLHAPMNSIEVEEIKD